MNQLKAIALAVGLSAVHIAWGQSTFDIEVVDSGVQPKVGLVFSRFEVAPQARRAVHKWSVSQGVFSDLKLTDSFRLYKVPATNHRDMQSALESENIDTWRQRDIEFAIWGRISRKDAHTLTIEVVLWDVFRRREHQRIVRDATEEQLISVTHAISERIHQSVYGYPGWFSQRIGYVSKSQNDGRNWYRLITSYADGSDPKLLLETRSAIMSVAWSPQGTSVAYSTLERGKSQIWLQNIQSGKRIRIAGFKGINSSPSFSPDGRSIAFTLSVSGNTEIYVLQLAQRKLRRLTRHAAIDTEPVWLSNKQIIFTSDRQGGTPQIWLLDLDAGGAPKRLSRQGRYNVSATASPPLGDIIVVSAQTGGYKLARLNPTQGQVTPITDSRLAESPDLSGHSKAIVFSTYSKEQRAIAVHSLISAVTRVLPLPYADLTSPKWVPMP